MRHFLLGFLWRLLIWRPGRNKTCKEHRWEATRYNFWYIVTEQRCSRCGIHRYHTYKDLPHWFGDDPVWHEGRHP